MNLTKSNLKKSPLYARVLYLWMLDYPDHDRLVRFARPSW